MIVEWWRGHITLEIDNRRIRVGGEGYRPPPGSPEPDFVVYLRTIKNWEDGTPVTEAERAAVLDEIRSAAAKSGTKVEFE